MIRKLFPFITGLLIAVVLAGFLFNPPYLKPKKHVFFIENVGGVWRVVDSTNHANHKIKAHQKDTIIWKAVGTDAYIQFPDSLLDSGGPGNNLINGYTAFLKNGKRLKLKVKGNAKNGWYNYAVFCMADSTFARGDSPPKIIIK